MTPELPRPPRLSLADRQALGRALAEARDRDPLKRAQLDSIRKTSGWFEAASAAACYLQMTNLKLKPFQPVPMNGDRRPVDDFPGAGRAEAAALLQRLLAAGLSRFEPNPIAALARLAAKDDGGGFDAA
jgi:hypothetical protein